PRSARELIQENKKGFDEKRRDVSGGALYVVAQPAEPGSWLRDVLPRSRPSRAPPGLWQRMRDTYERVFSSPPPAANTEPLFENTNETPIGLPRRYYY